ncbi:MAG: sigma-70 family RNA polymerase sigma factor [Gemmatimonadota bacterium]
MAWTTEAEALPEVSPSLAPNEAVALLFESYGDMIYSLGLSLCGEREGAEDLVQETFLRALKSWDGFEGRSKASTWLYTIATRACRRMRRRRAGEPTRLESLTRLLPSGEEGLIQIPAEDDPEAEAVLRHATDAIRSAVAKLPLDFKLPFVLKEMVGFTLAEVGEVLGLKEATVKTRVHRARLKVRQQLIEKLPSAPAPAKDHARQECMALLRAKLEAMDRDAVFPLSLDVLCARCTSVFATLDFARGACVMLREESMSDDLRSSLAEACGSA